MTTVPNQFPAKLPCKIAFVGEAPGEEEEEHGKPFVGPSGRVFNAALRTAGLYREDCFVGNVFREKAEDNDVSEWMADPAHYGAAVAALGDDLRRADPHIVVALGGTAYHALTGSSNLTQARGAVQLATQCVPGVKMIATYHPAFLFHTWKMLAVVVGDFVKADQEAKLGRELVYPKRKLYLEPNINDVEFYLETWKDTTLLSVDIETGWRQITCIGFAPTAEEAMVVPFVDLRQADKSYWRTPEEEFRAWMAVKKLMESPVPKLGQHFAGYDAYWFLRKWGIAPRNFREDTRLLHAALYPELPKSLEFMGNSYGRQGVWKSWGHRQTEKDDD